MKMKTLLMAGTVLAMVAACTPEGQSSPGGEVAEDAANAEASTNAEAFQTAQTAASGASVDYDSVLAGEQRSAENRARDAFRHPAETLAFFGLRPGMTVVEIAPGGGWYTEVLAGALGPQGTLYAAHTDPESSEGAARSVAGFDEKLAGNPVYANTERTVFAKGNADELAPAGTADMVLTFRNIHNFYIGGWAPDAFAAFYAALKPGGILGVVEHRLPEDAEDARMNESGYMKRSTVVKMAEDAGFELVDESEVNANPKDTADYEKGVWTLPPTLANGETNRDKYVEIGESDRMTLKFRKPA